MNASGDTIHMTWEEWWLIQMVAQTISRVRGDIPIAQIDTPEYTVRWEPGGISLTIPGEE